ncbi:carboxylating nicotinate-nucleotide diphosphorylase [Candidatus Bipolaricaulota bacterium]|nr:carboxylating nicotinate-nucleotide diphosphorylase [Candidatus Bipolaricaulota bacterium]
MADRCAVQAGLNSEIEAAVRRALQEDVGSGDATTVWTVPEQVRAEARILARESGIVAGLAVAAQVFAAVDPAVSFHIAVNDGARVKPGDIIAHVRGSVRPILTAERTALNFLQRMSGIATLTDRYVTAVAGTDAVILDTRKTAPGLRTLDKWAVRLGGGQNHRMGLFDMVLIKENHIAAAGSITAAVNTVRTHNRAGLPIEVEVQGERELEEALTLAVDRIMLDNMSLKAMERAVRLTAGKVSLEASGGVNLEMVRKIAMTGVDYISVGALTHSAPSLDISLKLVK